jgi:hypothetical protein
MDVLKRKEEEKKEKENYQRTMYDLSRIRTGGLLVELHQYVFIDGRCGPPPRVSFSL